MVVVVVVVVVMVVVVVVVLRHHCRNHVTVGVVVVIGVMVLVVLVLVTVREGNFCCVVTMVAARSTVYINNLTKSRSHKVSFSKACKW